MFQRLWQGQCSIANETKGPRIRNLPLWKLWKCRSCRRETSGNSTFLKKSGKTYLAWEFCSRSLPFFTQLHSKWYNRVEGKNIQVLPSDIGDLLTPRALAYWLSGDGNYSKRDHAVLICQNSFSPTEVDLLRAVLLDKLNIESTRVVHNKGKKQFVIRIPKGEVHKVQQLVKPFMPSMMRYRIGL